MGERVPEARIPASPTTNERPMRILLVEDNRELSDVLAKTLRADKFAVDCVYDGADANHVLETEEYGLVILDLSLPHVDGWEILRRLRSRGKDVPVLILTANDTIDARVAGLDGGADDYLVKPFDVSELEARIRVQLRRANAQKNPLIACGSLLFDSKARNFTLNGRPLSLTPREHTVLEALIVRVGRAVSKAKLATTVFGFDDEANPNAIEIYVHRVRKKLEGSDVGILTVRGLGYILKEIPHA